MNRSVRNRIQSGWAAALSISTAVEALRIDEPLLAILSTMAAVGAASVLVGDRRPVFLLRPDLASWVLHTAAAGDETPDRIVATAVARQRDATEGPWDGSN